MDKEQQTVSMDETRVRGKTIYVPSVEIDGLKILMNGYWLKVASVKDEDVVEPSMLVNPQRFVNGLKDRHLGVDLFTFVQKVPETAPQFDYPFEWDNMAVVPITTYEEWLEKRVEQDVRKGIRKATRLGVTARSVEFSDELVRGIVAIYAESPTRQGKAFWHYQKDFETVKHESGTYLEKSEFIGAYFQDELIGFIKMAYVGQIASTIHVIAMKKHFDKKATSLMLAKAVEICVQRRVTHLTYGNYVYGDPSSSLTEFKRRNGFEQMLLPRYIVPLTVKGKISWKIGAHHGLEGIVPEWGKALYKRVRGRLYKSWIPDRTKKDGN